MKVKLARQGAAILGCAAVFVLPTAVASADPIDPHQPDMTKGFCPGGRWGWGNLAVCDGEKYPDGSYWHQWMKTWMVGSSVLLRLRQRRRTSPGPAAAGWLQR